VVFNHDSVLIDSIQGRTLDLSPHGESGKKSSSVTALFYFEGRWFLDGFGFGEIISQLHSIDIGQVGHSCHELGHWVWHLLVVLGVHGL
jgi:hypothetical protein